MCLLDPPGRLPGTAPPPECAYRAVACEGSGAAVHRTFAYGVQRQLPQARAGVDMEALRRQQAKRDPDRPIGADPAPPASTGRHRLDDVRIGEPGHDRPCRRGEHDRAAMHPDRLDRLLVRYDRDLAGLRGDRSRPKRGGLRTAQTGGPASTRSVSSRRSMNTPLARATSSIACPSRIATESTRPSVSCRLQAAMSALR